MWLVVTAGWHEYSVKEFDNEKDAREFYAEHAEDTRLWGDRDVYLTEIKEKRPSA
jgi:hypothetical protein